MSLTPSLSSAIDLFGKLQRDAAAIQKHVTSDEFFNFVVTGYSLIDWVKNDPSLSPSAKANVSGLYKDRWLKVCGDLANASKHFILDKRTPITNSASAQSGFGVGRWGGGLFGQAEESIIIELNDGTSFGCLDLVREVVSTWQNFFAANTTP